MITFDDIKRWKKAIIYTILLFIFMISHKQTDYNLFIVLGGICLGLQVPAIWNIDEKGKGKK